MIAKAIFWSDSQGLHYTSRFRPQQFLGSYRDTAMEIGSIPNHLAIMITAVLVDYVQEENIPAQYATFYALTKCLLLLQ